MIVLDTNVLSESLKPFPSEDLERWLRAQDRSVVFTTAINQAEILYGVELLPGGKRRAHLHNAVQQMLIREFAGKILPFDESAARLFGPIITSRNAAGRPISQFDAMIAAITRSHRATIATRDTAGFELCGIQVMNPWLGR